MDFFSFLKLFDTDKVRFLGSRWRLLIKIFEFISKEYYCKKCNMSDLVREFPGEFRDWDADESQGGDGIPLCTNCIGTGKYSRKKSFLTLQERAVRVRSNNRKLFSGFFIEKVITLKEYKQEIAFNNDLLFVISQKSIKIIKYPEKGCLATVLRAEHVGQV